MKNLQSSRKSSVKSILCVSNTCVEVAWEKGEAELSVADTMVVVQRKAGAEY